MFRERLNLSSGKQKEGFHETRAFLASLKDILLFPRCKLYSTTYLFTAYETFASTVFLVSTTMFTNSVRPQDGIQTVETDVSWSTRDYVSLKSCPQVDG